MNFASPVENRNPTGDGEAMLENCEESMRTGSGDLPVKPKWFAAYTASHHEKHVFDLLTDRHVESFLPLYKTRRQWKKRATVTLEVPLFPNYIFIRIAGEQRSAVLGTPGVFSIVGDGKHAWELPEWEIEALRIGVQNRVIEPHPYLVVGERAKVRAGALAGLEGVILRKKSNLRIVLTLDQIMRSVAVEVGADELEPISRPSLMLN